MRPHGNDDERRQGRLRLERRLQTGAALLLGFVVLVALVLRASLGGGLAVGWWRP